MSLLALTRTFLFIGLAGFGGPAGQIGLLHRVLVEEKRWVEEERFLHALNLCMLLPGPEAQQLATYCGWMLRGVRGGLIAGLLFILPGLAVILALSAAYVTWHDAGPVAGLFFGLKAAVLTVVFEAVFRVARTSLKDRFARGLAVASFVALFLFQLPFPLVVLAAGLAGLLRALPGRDKTRGPKPLRPPASPVPPRPFRAKGKGARLRAQLTGFARSGRGRALLTFLGFLALWQAPHLFLPLPGQKPDLLMEVMTGDGDTLSQIFSFFSGLALVTFGGAYAALAYVAQQAAGPLGWLTPKEMLDGLALGEATPGPLVLVLSYVGFLAAFRNPGMLDPMLAGVIGGVLAAWATFLPSFLFIFSAAPLVERLRRSRLATGALSAVTAAVTGVILNLAVTLTLHVLFATVGRVTLVPFPRALSGEGPEGVTALLSLPFPDLLSLDLAALALAILAALLQFRLKAPLAVTLAVPAALGFGLAMLGLA